jgi:uncharacterized membrane protein (UPF0127 family)
VIENVTTAEMIASRVVRCDTFARRGCGLMFRRAIDEDEVYLFVEAKESKIGAAIHMFFVFFPIAVLWLDRDRVVVTKILARPWRPYYAPSQPAQFYLEGHPSLLDRVSVGDQLSGI